MKAKLLTDINEWILIHKNPYDHSIEEKAYWTIIDIHAIVERSDDEHVISSCSKMFNRFKYYC